MTVLHGVKPIVAPVVQSTDRMLARDCGGQRGSANMMKLHRVGELGVEDHEQMMF